MSIVMWAAVVRFVRVRLHLWRGRDFLPGMSFGSFLLHDASCMHAHWHGIWPGGISGIGHGPLLDLGGGVGRLLPSLSMPGFSLGC